MEYLVNIPMCAYNHENYIAQAIEGIINQQTSFKYRLIIGEDCSTDNTRRIVKSYQERYPDKIKVLFNEKNLGAYQNSRSLFKECNAKYIALCDGDDYWTDPLKLQKQVEFLEKNNDYTIVWTKYKILSDGVLSDLNLWEPCGNEVDMDNLLSHYRTQTVTCMFRRCVLEAYQLGQFKHACDNTYYYMCLKMGNGFILDDITSVYRFHVHGSWNGASEFNKHLNYYETIEEIKELVNIDSASVNAILKKSINKIYYLMVHEVYSSGRNIKLFGRIASKHKKYNNVKSISIVIDFIKYINPFRSR